MPRIIVQTEPAAQPIEFTLSERIAAASLDSVHYRSQLMQRLLWAVADAEALETREAEEFNAPIDDPSFIRPRLRAALEV